MMSLPSGMNGFAAQTSVLLPNIHSFIILLNRVQQSLSFSRAKTGPLCSETVHFSAHPAGFQCANLSLEVRIVTLISHQFCKNSTMYCCCYLFIYFMRSESIFGSAASCPDNTFTCDSGECVTKVNPECDFVPDCTDGSDEARCGE